MLGFSKKNSALENITTGLVYLVAIDYVQSLFSGKTFGEYIGTDPGTISQHISHPFFFALGVGNKYLIRYRDNLIKNRSELSISYNAPEESETLDTHLLTE